MKGVRLTAPKYYQFAGIYLIIIQLTVKRGGGGWYYDNEGGYSLPIAV